MRFLAGFAVLLSLVPQSGAAFAEGHASCVKTTCEDKGQSCLSAAFTVRQACGKSAHQTCAKVFLSQKAACLRKEQGNCGPAYNASAASCLDTVKSCYATCGGPVAGKSIDFWCTGEIDETLKFGFCFGTPGRPVSEQAPQCIKQFEQRLVSQGVSGGLASLTCELLYCG